MGAKFLLDDNELLVKSNNFRGSTWSILSLETVIFYTLKWEGKWRRNRGEKFTIKLGVKMGLSRVRVRAHPAIWHFLLSQPSQN